MDRCRRMFRAMTCGLALLSAGPLMADEAGAAGARSGGLKPILPDPMPGNLAGALLTREVRKRIDDALLAGAGNEAEAALLDDGDPLTAVAIQLRLVEEKDPGLCKRLEALRDRSLADSPRLAAALRLHAQHLHTCGSNVGPLRKDFERDTRARGSLGFDRKRTRAKTVHLLFVGPNRYSPQGLTGCMPRLDLPAAGDLYMLASAVYARLADAEREGEACAVDAGTADLIGRLVAQLGDREFAKREEAQGSLLRLLREQKGLAPRLALALKDSKDPEARERLERILDEGSLYRKESERCAAEAKEAFEPGKPTG